MVSNPSSLILLWIPARRLDNQYSDVNIDKTNPVHVSYRLPHNYTLTHMLISPHFCPHTHRLLQVGNEDADDQRVCVYVVHAVQWWLGGGPYGLVNSLFAGAVGGTVVGVVGKALGHLILTGGGAPGHSQQARRIQLGRTRREKRSDSHELKLFIREGRH